MNSQVSLKLEDIHCLGYICLGIVLQGHIVVQFLVLEGKFSLISQMASLINTQTNTA